MVNPAPPIPEESAVKPTLKRRGVLSPRAIIRGGVCVALFMAGLCAFVLYQSRLDSFERGQEAARNVGTLIERDISRNFELYALSLDAVKDGLSRPDVRALPLAVQRQILFDRVATAKYLGSLLVLDKAGNVIIDAGSVVPRYGNFADRDYFTIQRDNPQQGLYVSRPYRSRLRGSEPSIALSQRLSGPDGSFAGIVFIAVNLRYFQDLFAGLTFGERGTITLMNIDGAVVSRVPSRPDDLGRTLKGTAPFARILASDSGSFEVTAVSDGIDRLYVFRKIPGLPLYVDVGVSLADMYASWWKRALWIGIPVIVFSIVFVILSIFFAIQMKRRLFAEQTLELLAKTDGLTGLNNRRTLDDILELEWREAVRSKRDLSVIFVDIDRFKAYNDTYGHQAGDDALVAVANCINESLVRPGDRAARYGGEEFVVLLPDTSVAAAQVVAEAMRRAVSERAIEHALSEFGRVTISIGIATWPVGSPLGCKSLINAADEALYQAKATGRNRVAIYRWPDLEVGAALVVD